MYNGQKYDVAICSLIWPGAERTTHASPARLGPITLLAAYDGHVVLLHGVAVFGCSRP